MQDAAVPVRLHAFVSKWFHESRLPFRPNIHVSRSKLFTAFKEIFDVKQGIHTSCPVMQHVKPNCEGR